MQHQHTGLCSSSDAEGSGSHGVCSGLSFHQHSVIRREIPLNEINTSNLKSIYFFTKVVGIAQTRTIWVLSQSNNAGGCESRHRPYVQALISLLRTYVQTRRNSHTCCKLHDAVSIPSSMTYPVVQTPDNIKPYDIHRKVSWHVTRKQTSKRIETKV